VYYAPNLHPNRRIPQLGCVHIEGRRKIAKLCPFEAKRVGRRCKLSADWDEIKIKVMEYTLRIKFEKGTSWYKKLMATDGEIVEWNNWHDTFWGKCICRRCKGEGENNLGKLLMKIRDEGRD